MELYCKVRLACRDGMSARGSAPFRGLAREREEDARVLRSAGVPTADELSRGIPGVQQSERDIQPSWKWPISEVAERCR